MIQFSNIIDFVESPHGLNLKLFPAQKFILKRMYCIPLDDIERTIKVGDWDDPLSLVSERMYNQLLSQEGRISAGDHSSTGGDAVISLGRRSGKTLLICSILLWELHQLLSKGNPHQYFGLPESSVIQLLVVGCNRSQAELIKDQARELMLQNDIFRSFLRGENAIGMSFATPDQIERGSELANVKVLFRDANISGLRGASNFLVVLDEVNFFSDPVGAYRAVSPSVQAFSKKDPELGRVSIGPLEGRVVLISTPMSHGGLFEKLYTLAVHPDTGRKVFAYQAPTWEVNPVIPKEMFTEWFLSQDVGAFLCEFGGMFTYQHRSWEVIRALRSVLSEATGISAANREFVLQEMRRRVASLR